MMRFENTFVKPAHPKRFRTSAARPLALLSQCPAYQPTPMPVLAELAAQLGVAQIYLKDESTRMNLGSFKALGGAYALAQMIIDMAGTEDLASTKAREAAKEMTFITASAGNHGLSVAAGARVFGANAVIVLSASVPEAFAQRIRALDAQVVQVPGNYEDSVAHAIALVEQGDGVLLADGSWPGYTERPALILEGYSVLAHEAAADFKGLGVWPSHVFLQAGVGGLAAAMAAHIRENWPEQPKIIVVEPEAAPCLLLSMQAGEMVHAPGPESVMGRLDCKDASILAYEALRDDADLFVTVSDEQAQAAVVLLQRHGYTTTPSGAAGLAALAELEIDGSSRCLVIMSEGAV